MTNADYDRVELVWPGKITEPNVIQPNSDYDQLETDPDRDWSITWT